MARGRNGSPPGFPAASTPCRGLEKMIATEASAPPSRDPSGVFDRALERRERPCRGSGWLALSRNEAEME